MANQINTVERILTELNHNLQNNPWQEIPSIFSLKSAVINNGNIGEGPQIIVIKAFVNVTTGEIKTYLAKWLNVPETISLP